MPVRSRSAARLAAVQALYQREMEPTPVPQLLHEFHHHRLGETIDGDEYADAEVDFFDDIVKGVAARAEELDGLIAGKLAKGWSLARPITDEGDPSRRRLRTRRPRDVPTASCHEMSSAKAVTPRANRLRQRLPTPSPGCR